MRLPAPATVISTVALVVALGGTSYAALTITSANVKNNSLKSVDVRNNALKSADVRNGSLLAKDFRAGQLPAGAQGPAGPAGPTGPAGAAGAAGPPGPTASAHATDLDGTTLGSSRAVVASATITVATRSRLVATSTVEVSGAPGGASSAFCSLYSGADAMSRGMSSGIPETGVIDQIVIPVTGSIVREAGTYTVTVECAENSGDANASEAELTVVAAGA
jgi:hypothetical protein